MGSIHHQLFLPFGWGWVPKSREMKMINRWFFKFFTPPKEVLQSRELSFTYGTGNFFLV
jgi:hypothetical protein